MSRPVSDSRFHPDVTFTITDRITCVFLTPLATELKRRGHTVGLITNLHGEPPPPGMAPSLDWHADLAMRRNPSPIHDAADLVHMTRLLRRNRPQVLHASTPKAGLLGTIAGRIARVPRIVLQVRGLRSEGASGINGWLQRQLESLSMQLAHDVVFNSHSMLDAARATGLRVPRRAVVLGRGSSIGVDCERFHPGRTDDPRPTIGFVGRLHTDKGAADLIPLLDALLSDHPDLRLIVVGDMDPTDPASPAIREALANRQEVELRGWVDDPAPVYREMDLLVFPSRREGLPNAPLEAQASGVPVVGYAATGTVDAVEDGVGGLLVPVGDLDALAAAIRALLDDPEGRHAMGTAAQQGAETHFAECAVLDRQICHLVAAPTPRSTLTSAPTTTPTT